MTVTAGGFCAVKGNVSRLLAMRSVAQKENSGVETQS